MVSTKKRSTERGGGERACERKREGDKRRIRRQLNIVCKSTCLDHKCDALGCKNRFYKYFSVFEYFECRLNFTRALALSDTCVTSTSTQRCMLSRVALGRLTAFVIAEIQKCKITKAHRGRKTRGKTRRRCIKYRKSWSSVKLIKFGDTNTLIRSHMLTFGKKTCNRSMRSCFVCV